MSRKSYESAKSPLRWRNCIRQQREARGTSQADLARASSMYSNNLTVIERHQREPKIGTLLRIAAALECKVDDLIELEDAGSLKRNISRSGDLQRSQM